MAPIEIAAEAAVTMEMNQQPAIHFLADKDGIPRLLAAGIQEFIAHEAAPQASLHSSLKPLQDKLVEIVEGHHLQAIFWIAKKHRVQAFAKVVAVTAQSDNRCAHHHLHLRVVGIIRRGGNALEQKSLAREPV